MTPHKLSLIKDFAVSYLGPHLDEGPLPAVFYFALSAKESLQTDPYNQPALALAHHHKIRIFSMDLPAHGEGLPAVEAINVWAHEIAHGKNVIGEFVSKAQSVIENLKERGIFIENQVGVMGLSRGGFIACHLASKLPFIRLILGFAPLTSLSYAREFHDMQENPLVMKLNLEHLIPSLFNRTIRFYIGNRDIRVGTTHCFHFVSSLVEAAFQNKIRSPQIELIINPSIGHQGHGTSKEIFEAGALWMAQELAK